MDLASLWDKGCHWTSTLIRSWEMHFPKKRRCCRGPAGWHLGSHQAEWPALLGFGDRSLIFSMHAELMCCSPSLCVFASLAEACFEELLPPLVWRAQVSPEISDCLPLFSLRLNHGDAVLWGTRRHLNAAWRCETSHGAERTQLARSSRFWHWTDYQPGTA